MTWAQINRADGRRWRRAHWPERRWIWFAPSYVLIHWEKLRTVNGETFNVEKHAPAAEDKLAADWEELPRVRGPSRSSPRAS